MEIKKVVNYSSSNRMLCTVFDEMRQCVKTHNFALLPSLIEEAQCYGNRMESKLEDYSDIQYNHEELKEREVMLDKLREEHRTLTSEIGAMEKRLKK